MKSGDADRGRDSPTIEVVGRIWLVGSEPCATLRRAMLLPRFPTPLALALVAATCACSSAAPLTEPRPLWPPGVKMQFAAHAGTAIAGHSPSLTGAVDTGAIDPAALKDAWCVRIELIALSERPAIELRSLASHTSLILALDHEDPFAPTALFAAATEIATGEQARAVIAELDRNSADDARRGPFFAALPEGVTVSLGISMSETLHEPENFLNEYPELGVVKRSFTIELDRGFSEDARGGARLALCAEDVAPPPAWLRRLDDGSTFRGRPATAHRAQREAVLYGEPLLPDTGPLVLITRARSGVGRAVAYAVIIEVTATPPDSARERFEAHRADLAGQLEKAQSEARARMHSLTPEEADAAALRTALAALGMSSSPRAALLHLSGGAFLAQDLALVADEQLLDEFIDGLSESAREQNELGERDKVAWWIERSAHLFLARLSLAGRLPRPLEAVFLRHAGEAARYPSTLVALVAAAGDMDSLASNLVREHRAMLADSNPAVRLRATDWLDAREALPGGFDPLGPVADRKAFLTALDGEQQ